MAYNRFSNLLVFSRAALVCASLLAALQTAPASANERELETLGVLSTLEQGQIAPDIWAGTKRTDALMLVKALPVRYASPTYYSLSQRFLLSEAPLIAAPEAEANTPDLLIARLDKLLEIGALRAAEELYEATVEDVPQSFELALRSLQILMLRGELSAACLDLQAMQSQHQADPRWRELNAFCMIRFADGATRSKLLAESKFEAFPVLNRLLKGGIPPSGLASLKVQELAFATALGFVDEAAMRQLTSNAGALPSLLLTVLYETDTAASAPEKTCLAIESLRRGMLSTRDLISLYERPHYEAALLLNDINLPPSAANIHPCMIPTVLYQRIASHTDSAPRNTAIRVAFDVMSKMPDAAFLPMAKYLQDTDLSSPQNRPYLSRIARIIAYERGELPESWNVAATTAKVGADEAGAQQASVSPVWLVHAIVKPELATPENLALWRKTWPQEAQKQASRDPYLPVILGRAAVGQGGGSKNRDKTKLGDGGNYENESSLTFSRTYAMPSYGLTQRLKDVIEKGQTGQSVALLLIGYGAIPPDQVIPDQMALIIEGLNKNGLRGDAQRMALEILR